jgi:transcriptional regulator with XRE-family HTH domain
MMPEMDYSKLSGRIREKGLTQKALASIVGLSEGQMSQKMKGNYLFKQSEIRGMCDALDIEPAEIGTYFFTPAVEKTQSRNP